MLPSTNKEKVLLKHNDFSTSFPIFRQSSGYQAACISLGTGVPWKDDSGKFFVFHWHARAALLQEQVQDIALPFSHQRKLFRACAARPEDNTSQTPLTLEASPRHITHHSLLMSGTAHIFYLYVSVRLPEQPLGSSGDCPERQPYGRTLRSVCTLPTS